jgi:hypothetical protein
VAHPRPPCSASALPYIEYVQTTGHKVSGIYSYIHTVGQTVLLPARDQDLSRPRQTAEPDVNDSPSRSAADYDFPNSMAFPGNSFNRRNLRRVSTR